MTDNRSLEFFINMGTYKPKYVSIRVVITSVLSVLLIYIAASIIDPKEVLNRPIIYGYLISIVAFNCITELNIFFINVFKFTKKYSKNIYIYILGMLIITMLLTFLFIGVAEFILGANNVLQNKITQIVLILGLLILLVHLLIILLSNLTKEWFVSKKELSDLKEAKLLSDYNSLKDRLNPHFLFNNLSVLKSLITYSPKDAEIFTQNFTNVYRYVLNSHEKNTVSLQDELEFIKSYIALHQERLGEGLRVLIKIDKDYKKKEIIPMSLQLLVENAIKHNIASKTQKLNIDIYTSKQYIAVKNNINKKETTYSTQTGLSSLIGQYKIMANKEVVISDDNKFFVVEVPFL